VVAAVRPFAVNSCNGRFFWELAPSLANHSLLLDPSLLDVGDYQKHRIPQRFARTHCGLPSEVADPLTVEADDWNIASPSDAAAIEMVVRAARPEPETFQSKIGDLPDGHVVAAFNT